MGSDELDEKDFIQNRNSKYTWTFLVLFLLALAVIWSVTRWERVLVKEEVAEDLFYQVTNREFSLFLWQNPEFMRSNAHLSEAYLPDFHTNDNVHVIPEFADNYVSAPPVILYRYHVWKRLIGTPIAPHSIAKQNFVIFLNKNPEWLPEFWKAAPTRYKKMLSDLPDNIDTLPLDVQMAFQGWWNYTYEWDKIERIFPSERELEQFLKRYPHYGRSYWRNLIPHYLLNEIEERPISELDLSPFLKVGLFNYSTMTNPSL